MRRICATVAMLIAHVVSGALQEAMAQEPLTSSILVLDQSDIRSPLYYEVFSSLRSAVNRRRGPPISLYVESLDLSRFPGQEYEESLRLHFGTKYRNKPIGVVVAIGSATLDYALRKRAELWPGIPVVFAMVDEPTVARLAPLPPGVTRKVMKLRLEDMVIAARAVVPDLKQIVLLGDLLEGQTAYRHFLDELPKATAGVEVTNLTGLPMREL